jgi:hypothetical protein
MSHSHNQCLHHLHTLTLYSLTLQCHFTTYCHQTHSLHWLNSTFETPYQSILMKCVTNLWWSTDKEQLLWASSLFYLGSEPRPHPKSQPLYSHIGGLEWLVYQNIEHLQLWDYPTKYDQRFLFVELIVGFISGIRCPLNAYSTSIPHFLWNTPGLLFHTTANHCLLSS